MQKYFVLEIFPKLGSSFSSLQGSIEFIFESRNCLIKTANKPIELKLRTGSKSHKAIPEYFPVYLYFEKKNQETPFLIGERICDVISLATGNHVAYFAPKISEYTHFSSWGITKEIPSTQEKALFYKNTESEALEKNLLLEVIKRIAKNSLKERILASIHINRLAKYKSLTHITEGLTDSVNSLEALYLKADNGLQDKIDCNLFPNNTPRTKSDALVKFIELYHPQQAATVPIIDSNHPYEIRSSYLHRGNLIEPASGDYSYHTKSQKKVEKFLKYNQFHKIVYETILNFVLETKV